MTPESPKSNAALSRPTLASLPAPPPGRFGWPWTVGNPPIDGPMADGHEWPRITIVTPSLNQAQFLEETIRSVLLQGYPNLEFMVIDGGSTDGSVEIVRRYRDWLAFWVSEPDGGQANGINKGLGRATGTVFNWINSDDTLLPDALRTIGEEHRAHPRSLLAGDVVYRYEGTATEKRMTTRNLLLKPMVEFWWNTTAFHQPGLFVPTKLLRQTGFADEKLHYAFDYELYCRLLQITDARSVLRPIATYRIHSTAKSVSKKELFLAELLTSSHRHWPNVPNLRFPWGDRRGAGLLMKVGLWKVVHGQASGLDTVAEAARLDLPGALLSTALAFPGWMGRKICRKAQGWRAAADGSFRS